MGSGADQGEAAVARTGARERGCLGTLHYREGADGLTADCWAPGVFYWRKGKAGHAVDSASGLFLWEPPEAAILPSAQQPCWLAALHGLAS